MNDWYKGLSKSQTLGWIGICFLATAIVLFFVRRLLGIEIDPVLNDEDVARRMDAVSLGSLPQLPSRRWIVRPKTKRT